MEESNRFFRFLGRTNTILLTLCGLAVLVVLVTLFGGEPWRAARQTPDAGARIAGNDPEFSYDLAGSLDYFDNGTLTVLDGADEAMMILRRQHKTTVGSFSASYTPVETVNIMIVNLRDGRSRWLFRGLGRDISTAFLVHGAEKPDRSVPVTALLLEVADKDTSGDDKIDDHDAGSLYLYRIGGEGAVKILPAQGISNIVQIGPGKIAVTYYDGKDDRIVLLATSDFKPIAGATLAPTPH